MNNAPNNSASRYGESQERPARRRTVWIWVILVVALWGFIGLLHIWTTTESQIQQGSKLIGIELPVIGILGKVIASLSSLLFFLAAWTLFMLRASAVKLFAIGLAVNIVNMIYSIVMVPNFLSFMTSLFGSITLLYGFGVSISVLLYSMRLRRRGVLV
jgi:hypothetical protein